MRRKWRSAVLMLTAVMVLLAVWYMKCALSNGDEQKADAFYCFVIDSQNCEIDGYYSDKEEQWYLFLTCREEISDIVVNYGGIDLQEVSRGNFSVEKGTVSGAFVLSGDTVVLTDVDGEEYAITVLQSELPSLYISLKDAELETIWQDKNVKYEGNSAVLTSVDGQYDFNAPNSVELKGRGNTSWLNYGEKKGYQIEFAEKIPVLGMDAAKRWILLANASDDSMMRNKLIFDMAGQMDMGYVPEFEYIDLWIDGDYQGTYLLGEKAEIDENRLNLTDASGVLMEWDDSGALTGWDDFYYREGDIWTYEKYTSAYFVVKDSVSEGNADTVRDMAEGFTASLEALMAYIVSTDSTDITLEDLERWIDVDSVIKYYLINEYAQNDEGFRTSFYWYRDGEDDVIHMGPIWDFDSCMGYNGTNYRAIHARANTFFGWFLSIPVVQERTLELWEQYVLLFSGLSAQADSIKETLEASAEMNYLRWDVLGKLNPKGGDRFL